MDLKYEHKYKKYKNKYNDLKGGCLYETINEFFNYPFYLTNESVAKIIDTITVNFIKSLQMSKKWTKIKNYKLSIFLTFVNFM